MPQLSFYARGDLLVSHPTARRFVGQLPRYVGRKPVANGSEASWPATQQPFVCEADSDIGRRLVKLCGRDHALWPADETTARACNVPFQPVEFADGEWVPRRTELAEQKSKAKPPKD